MLFPLAVEALLQVNNLAVHPMSGGKESRRIIKHFFTAFWLGYDLIRNARYSGHRWPVLFKVIWIVRSGNPQ